MQITIPDHLNAVRIDKALAEMVDDLSRSRIQALMDGGQVMLNGAVHDNASYKVSAGDVIAIEIPPAEEAEPQAQNIPLDIVYEDDDLLVINKQAGLVVHPGAGNPDGTLVNALLYHCGDSLSGIGGVKRPGIVHRIDKDTTGLLVVAKHDRAHQGLSDQLADRSLSRTYDALVWRVPMPIKGTVDQPIGRHPSNRQKMSIGGSGAREARTHYMVVDSYHDCVAQLECKLESGRTHQIRVHMAHIKHPLLGDGVYGLNAQESRSALKKAGFEGQNIDDILNFPRQALHAAEIRFIHPVSGDEMGFSAGLPEDMQNLLKLLK